MGPVLLMKIFPIIPTVISYGVFGLHGELLVSLGKVDAASWRVSFVCSFTDATNEWLIFPGKQRNGNCRPALGVHWTPCSVVGGGVKAVCTYRPESRGKVGSK